MSRKSYLFTSESVSEGHPDKVCDRISDEVVDLFFREGPKAGIDPWQLRVACETLATTNQVVIAGETRGPKTITKDWVAHVARMAIKDIGYEQDGFHWDNANIEVLLHPQSADIAAGRRQRRQQGRRRRRPGHHVRLRLPRDARADAGADLLQPQDPAPDLARRGTPARRRVLGPDSKSQVTVRYENGKPVGVTQIVVSHQHLVESMTSDAGARARRALRPKALPERLDRQGHGLAHQSDRQVLHRRPRRRLRPHRPQDHRRHLRRRGPAWRRRVLRQGPDQGRPLGRLCGALSRQERGGGGPGRPLHHPARLRHRRRQAAVDLCRPRRQPQQDRRRPSSRRCWAS